MVSTSHFRVTALVEGLFLLFAALLFAADRAEAQLPVVTSPPSAPANSAPNGVELTVLSYNVHHVEGTDGRLNLERIARVINESRAEIVALQEVDVNVQRSEKVDQATELARLTGMVHSFGGNIELEGGQYGNALLTRGKIISSINHALPNIENGEQRGVMDVMIEWKGQPIRVLVTHFDHRRDPRCRLESIDMINKFVQDSTNQPTLLLGDLNADFGSEVVQRAARVWTIANQDSLPTFPVDQPTRQIDFILTWPANRWQTQDVSVLEEALASDHRPIVARLLLNTESK